MYFKIGDKTFYENVIIEKTNSYLLDVGYNLTELVEETKRRFY